MPVDPDVANLLALIEAGGVDISAGTPDEARQALTALMVGLNAQFPKIDVAAVADDTLAGVPVRVYRPEGDGSHPTVVYIHGGGFVIGDLETHDGICRQLVRDTDAVVVSVDYRLAPEHPFPAAVDDSWAVVQHVTANIDAFGGDASKVAVGGDSAGGNLSAIVAQRAAAAGIPLAAQLLIYPAVDLLGDYPSREENGEGFFLTMKDMLWFAHHYLGIDETDPRAAELAVDPSLSPLHGNLDGVAPAIVATAEFDPLRDEGNAYAAALEKAGVPVSHQQFPGLIHGFYGLENLGAGIANATKWINAQLADALK